MMRPLFAALALVLVGCHKADPEVKCEDKRVAAAMLAACYDAHHSTAYCNCEWWFLAKRFDCKALAMDPDVFTGLTPQLLEACTQP